MRESAAPDRESRVAQLGIDPALFEKSTSMSCAAGPHQRRPSAVSRCLPHSLAAYQRTVRSTRHDGEISLQPGAAGRGIKEKVVAAAAAGLTGMLPARNRRDFDEIPQGAATNWNSSGSSGSTCGAAAFETGTPAAAPDKATPLAAPLGRRCGRPRRRFCRC